MIFLRDKNGRIYQISPQTDYDCRVGTRALVARMSHRDEWKNISPVNGGTSVVAGEYGGTYAVASATLRFQLFLGIKMGRFTKFPPQNDYDCRVGTRALVARMSHREEKIYLANGGIYGNAVA